MVVATRSFMEPAADLTAHDVDTLRTRRIQPCIDRCQRRTTRTENQETVHEAADGNSGRRIGLSQRPRDFRKRTLDVVDRQRRAAVGISMKIPQGIVSRQDLQALIESRSAYAAGSDIETKNIHALALLDRVTAEFVPHDGEDLVSE